MANIYRQAKELLDKKDAGGEISWSEFQLIKTAELPLILRGCPLPEDMPLGECLKELAQIVERANLTEEPIISERAKAKEEPKELERAIRNERSIIQERARSLEKTNERERAIEGEVVQPVKVAEI